MELFAGEKIHITALNYVLTHRSDGAAHDYSTRLNHCELIYKVSGACDVRFDGQVLHERAGDIRFLPRGDRFVEYKTRPVAGGESIYFSFNCEGLLPDHACVITPRSSEAYRVLFEKLYRTWTLREKGYYQKALSLVYQIIGCLQDEQGERYLPGRQREIIERSGAYLEAHVFDPAFDYGALAEAGGVSYSYYKRLFGKRFGMPPSKYILGLRLRRACELLDAGRLSVAQTAEAVGFEDAAYFCRVFKKEMGVPPALWRRNRQA